MVFTETVIEHRGNTWRESETERALAPSATRTAPTWSEAEAIGAEAESWLSDLVEVAGTPAGTPDIDLAGSERGAPFGRRPKNTWREPLDGVGRRNLG